MRDLMFSAGFVGSVVIINPPENVVTLQSSSVTLTCGFSGDIRYDSLEWRSYVDDSVGTVIYTSITRLLSDPFKYAIDDDYSLTIKSLTIADGGRYSCILGSDGIPKSADVIVISKYYTY